LIQKSLVEDPIGLLNAGQAHNAKHMGNISSMKAIKSRGQNLKPTKRNQRTWGNGFKESEFLRIRGAILLKKLVGNFHSRVESF